MLGVTLWHTFEVELVAKLLFDVLKEVEGIEYTKNGGTATSSQFVCSQSYRKRALKDEERKQRVVDCARRHKCYGTVTI